MSIDDIKARKIEAIPEDKYLDIADCIGWRDNIKAYPEVMEYIEKNNCYEAYKLYPAKFWYDSIKKRVVFVEYETLNTLELAAGRSLIGEIPKWYNYVKHPTAYFISNPAGTIIDAPRRTFIVEDCASACSVSRIGTGLALTGTSWNIGKLNKKLLDIGSENVVIVLDQDAQVKAMKLKRALEGIGKYNSVKVVVPPDDLKYLNKAQLVNTFEGV